MLPTFPNHPAARAARGGRTLCGIVAGLALGGVLAAGMAGAVFGLRPEWRGALRSPWTSKGYVEVDDAEGGSAATSRLPRVPAASLVARFPLPEARYAKIEPGPASNPLLEWDPQTFYRYRGGIEKEYAWPEHPKGRWVLRTNAEGWREDEPFTPPGGDPLVLVTGDSHADGICDNHESFTNRVEDRLRSANPERDPRLWNTSKGGYAFYFYVGVLDKYLPLEPDLVVVTVYGGNDFVGQMGLFHAFEPRHVNPPRPKRYLQARAAGMRADNGAMMQSFNQLAYFAAFPEESEHALRTACEATLEMRRLCEEAGTALVLVYVPPLFDARAARFEELVGILGLDEEDLGWTSRTAERYLEFVRDEGFTLLDLRPDLEHRSEFAWRKDLHLNLDGHELVAERLAPLLAEILELRAE